MEGKYCKIEHDKYYIYVENHITMFTEIKLF